MTRYIWKSWSGGKRAIDATAITFEPAHVVFWDGPPLDRHIVLAVPNSDVIDLRPIEPGDTNPTKGAL